MSKMRILVLLALCALFVAAAHAQVTYQITSTPTFVINTGRAEVVGSVRITALNAGPTVASTIQVLYQGLSCDNNFTSGVQFFASGAYAAGAAPTGQTVTNTSAGCIVSFTIPGAVATVAGDFLEVQGVRGRIDFFGGVTNIGQNINASLNATPSNSSLFTAPTTVVVATTAVGLNVGTITPTTILQCVGITTAPSIVIQEGYNGAFVQHVAQGTIAVPTAARPVFGAVNNTQVRITLTSLPTGVTVAWPATVTSALAGGVFTAGVSGSELVLIATGTSGVTATYAYVCGDQGVCDITQESFTVAPTVTASPTAAFGTATAQARLWPDLITGDATSITSAPAGATAARPRFNDPQRPSPGGTFITTAPCSTNLLYPFVTNLAGFDTGIVIANTSSDPLPAANTANNQAGTCTITGFPQAGGAAVTFTTPTIPTGTTYSTVLSDAANAALNGFQGYLWVRCNFQLAHGFAFITDGFGGVPTRAMGFVPLVVPDPVVLGLQRGAPTCTAAQLGGTQTDVVTGATFTFPPTCIPNVGEGLTQ